MTTTTDRLTLPAPGVGPGRVVDAAPVEQAPVLQVSCYGCGQGVDKGPLSAADAVAFAEAHKVCAAQAREFTITLPASMIEWTDNGQPLLHRPAEDLRRQAAAEGVRIVGYARITDGTATTATVGALAVPAEWKGPRS